MAPLYHRYVPPKPAEVPAPPPIDVVSKTLPHVSGEAEHKRKRERSEEEKTERKAKKLRKKDDSTNETNAGALLLAEGPAPDSRAAQEDTAGVSEFAHITNAKKRHKLEKEARKARKEAAKPSAGTEEGLSDVAPARASGASKIVVEQSVDTSEPIADFATSPARSGELVKGEKRRKKRDRDVAVANQISAEPAKTIADGSKSDEDALATEQHTYEAVESPEPAVVGPKKRRHKLEAVLQQKNERGVDASGDDDEEHLRNYGSIMSKFQKSKEKAEKRGKDEPVDSAAAAPAQPVVEKRDLVPFPQPVNEPQTFKPTFSALPSWLSAPSTILNDSQATFTDLKLPAPLVQRLAKLGFKDALPVQQALIPLLLQPGTSGSAFSPALESVLPDIAVSAATGSGKTIAYLLPMIEALKQNASSSDRLRALVVVPTRELVSQVTAVAESLTKGSGLTVGTASGSGKFKDEQQRLVKTGKRYDPAGYRALMVKSYRREYPPPLDSEDFEDFVEEMERWNDHLEQEVQDAVTGLVDHVPTYDSAVDLLVCTPGRLLEHLNSTLGFDLSFVEWLVLDEADKLLDQQYDGVLQRLDEELSRPRTAEEQDPREKMLRSMGAWDERFERIVRKVVLSATMTRDISKLTALKLRRPKMIVVQGNEETDATACADTALVPESENGIFELPRTLKEYCVPVGDGAEKPLHLLELLSTRVLTSLGTKVVKDKPAAAEEDADDDSSDTDSSSDSDSSSDELDSDSDISTSESSDSDSDSDSASSSDSESDNSVSSTDSSTPDEIQPASSKSQSTKPTTALAPTILIFTSSTESATRLSHLLSNLRPDWSSYITSLTKTSSSPHSRNTRSTDPVITIATDRAGRGLDTLCSRAITHVLQYDVPRSLTAYVHRVGRTARAGRGGEAWTLYSDKEARWFVNEIMRAENVRRAAPVERVRVGVGGEEVRERFVEVLGGMREVVFGGGGEK